MIWGVHNLRPYRQSYDDLVAKSVSFGAPLMPWTKLLLANAPVPREAGQAVTGALLESAAATTTPEG